MEKCHLDVFLQVGLLLGYDAYHTGYGTRGQFLQLRILHRSSVMLSWIRARYVIQNPDAIVVAFLQGIVILIVGTLVSLFPLAVSHNAIVAVVGLLFMCLALDMNRNICITWGDSNREAMLRSTFASVLTSWIIVRMQASIGPNLPVVPIRTNDLSFVFSVAFLLLSRIPSAILHRLWDTRCGCRRVPATTEE